ncbi:hypothetical protein GIB67_021571 [Kingdonia uniflora]|uniref:RING-type domain-containing protein n=1 Tax=Kingdonia uniflora TaxID=39325 RepID=A0A7J7MDJ8_9MAGN|nr:hypothetical protein GIB67_021571 [Kingdonia uniflora]
MTNFSLAIYVQAIVRIAEIEAGIRERGLIEFDEGNSSMIQHKKLTEREAQWVVAIVSEEGDVALGSSRSKPQDEVAVLGRETYPIEVPNHHEIQPKKTQIMPTPLPRIHQSKKERDRSPLTGERPSLAGKTYPTSTAIREVFPQAIPSSPPSAAMIGAIPRTIGKEPTSVAPREVSPKTPITETTPTAARERSPKVPIEEPMPATTREAIPKASIEGPTPAAMREGIGMPIMLATMIVGKEEEFEVNGEVTPSLCEKFVEAVLGVRACSQYPYEPPHIDIVESKGLDEKRKAHLISNIREKAKELSSCLMFIALCEEAVEMLSNMNHPEGDCPLCLHPLVQDLNSDVSPFMKLMSCFHCFHSKCITRWWKWLQKENLSHATGRPSNLENGHDLPGTMKSNLSNCPVCRKVFHAKDIEHVVNLVGSHLSQLSFEDTETDNNEKILQSEAENIRRQKFEALLKLQEENSGLIEPKRIEVLMPGMFLPEPVTLPAESPKDTLENDSTSPTILEMGSSRPSDDPICSENKRVDMRKKPDASKIQPRVSNHQTTSGAGSSRSSSNPSSHEHKRVGMRRNKIHNQREQNKQWIKKDNGLS